MAMLAVKHTVADFDTWKIGFDSHQENREQHGCLGHRVVRDEADPNSVLIVTYWPDLAAAHAFVEDPSLREVMASAGVVSEPRLEFYEAAEERTYAPA